jgi:hypothetical protein
MLEIIHSSYTVKADADVFIIPNGLVTLDDFFAGKVARSEFIRNATVRDGITTIHGSSSDLLVQLWWTSEHDLGSDNLARHGFHFPDGGEEQYFSNDHLEYLPISMFAGHKEGDVLDFSFEWFEKDGTAINLQLHTTLNQLNYRYRSFGGFDELLEKLVDHHRGL